MTPEDRARLVSRMQALHASANEAIGAVDYVMCSTILSTPILGGTQLEGGDFSISISFRDQQIDAETVRRPNRISASDPCPFAALDEAEAEVGRRKKALATAA